MQPPFPGPKEDPDENVIRLHLMEVFVDLSKRYGLNCNDGFLKAIQQEDLQAIQFYINDITIGLVNLEASVNQLERIRKERKP